MKNTCICLLLLICSFHLAAQPSINRVEGSKYRYSAKPDKLYLTSESYTYSQKIALQTIQGGLAKTKPEILRDAHGHKSVVEKYISIDQTYYNNFQGLLNKFASRFAGYILCDAKQSSTNVAISLSGILNAIAIPADIESSAKLAGLTLLLDARGKNEAWALANYGAQFSKKTASYQNCSDDRGLFLGDYSTYTNAFQFWDESATGTLANSVYNRMDVGATFFGWGAGEYATVEQLSKKSMSIHPSDFSVNLSTLANIPVDLPKQKNPIAPFKVVPNVHTVCFVISDGDNIQWLSGTSDNKNNWANPDRTRLNLGWTISPAFAELAPAMYKKYVDNNITTSEGRNCLVASPSGIGYYFPGIMPNLANECDLLNKYMRKADLNIVNIIDVDLGAHNPNQYLRQSNIDALFYYTYGANYTGMNGKISWYKDKPSIGGRYTLWGTLSGPVDLADKLNKASTKINSEAGYSLIPVHIWSRNPTDVLECIKNLGPNVRVVAPDEFVWLVRKNIKGIKLGTGNGLKGEYFNSSNKNEPQYTQTDAKIDFDWGTSSPNSSKLGYDEFSIRWSGQIQSVYSEKYTFFATADDGVKLSINGRVLFDSLSVHGTNSQSDTITLNAGQLYDIIFEYNEVSGNAGCSLEWESASQMRQPIPHTQLYSRAKATTGLITAYSDCNFSGFSAGLKPGDYSLADLNFYGILDKDIESLKIANGYKVILFENDNFTGESKEVTATDTCLKDWGNKTSSLKIKANGITGLEGVYYLRNKSSNSNLEIAGGFEAMDNAVNVQIATASKNINQQFKLTHLGDGTYSIIAQSSQKSLDIADFSTTDGANVQQWSYYKSPNQQFIIVDGTDGAYKIIAKHSGKIIETISNLTGSNVRQFTDNNQTRGQWKLIPIDNQVNGSGIGLDAKYYNGMNFENLRYSTVDTTINFNWGNSAPYQKTNVDNFSVRWEGEILPRYSGKYIFYINSDNGRKLWINNQLIIDKWISDYGIEYSGNLVLTANRKYSLKLEYFEEAGGANCMLEWMSALQAREVVPRSQLFRIATDIDNPVVLTSKVKIYPNPVTNGIIQFNIKEFDPDDPLSITILNTMGTVINKTILTETGIIDVNEYPKGLYIISVKNKIIHHNQKIIIQ